MELQIVVFSMISFFAKDVGPGNCLMDKYIKKTKNLDFDDEGKIASLVTLIILLLIIF